MKYLKIVGVVIALLLIVLYRDLYMQVSDSQSPILFEVTKQESFADIVHDLATKNLVRNEMVTKLYARLAGLDNEVKAGRFKLDPTMSPVKILRFLVNPEHGEISVTIPEGYSLFDIDKKLTSLELIQKGDFLNWARAADLSKFAFMPSVASETGTAAGTGATRLEGYLFPDTYLVFSNGFEPQDLGEKMLQNFQKKVVTGLAAELQTDLQKSKRSLKDVITLASILEKEVRTKDDEPTVAGILWKRLDNGWPLQVDATLLYGRSDRTLSVNDIHDDSIYNTYTRQGLPATPISNPGLDMIQAALNPTDSPYWFYLTSRDGKTIYGKTNKEHEENKRKYL